MVWFWTRYSVVMRHSGQQWAIDHVPKEEDGIWGGVGRCRPRNNGQAEVWFLKVAVGVGKKEVWKDKVLILRNLAWCNSYIMACLFPSTKLNVCSYYHADKASNMFYSRIHIGGTGQGMMVVSLVPGFNSLLNWIAWVDLWSADVFSKWFKHRARRGLNVITLWSFHQLSNFMYCFFGGFINEVINEIKPPLAEN